MNLYGLIESGRYAVVFFYPETLVREDKSRAWIRLFIRNFEGLIFDEFLDPRGKFSFYPDFGSK